MRIWRRCWKMLEAWHDSSKTQLFVMHWASVDLKLERCRMKRRGDNPQKRTTIWIQSAESFLRHSL